MLLRDSSIHLLGALFMTISLSGLIMIPPASAHTHLKGRTLPIPDNPLTPPNQAPVTSLSRSQIASGLELPKNLIVPTCQGGGGSSTTGGGISSGGSGCPPIVGTDGPDIIIATGVPSAVVYGLDGNDVIQCGSGNCKVYGGLGDNIMTSSSSASAQLYGASGNNVFIGSGGDTLMVGGKGNDQFYAGNGHDVMIGGGGSNYFDCGSGGNGIILDFNAKNGDTKAPNCKFAITVNTGVPALP
ncbi:MAG: calcium-binding protein [Nitrososphaeraceae archaeon]